MKLDKFLDQRSSESLDTVKYYSEEEKFGKELYEKVQSGEVELSMQLIVDKKGRVQKATTYEKKNELFYGNNYSTCFAANFATWTRKWKPSSSTMVVLFELLANMRYYNYVLVSQAKLSTKLEFDQGTVSKALSFLENTEILEYVPETHLPAFIKAKPKVQRRWYRLSIDMFWRGAASEIDRAPKNYKMKFRERDSEPEECKSLEDALNKIDNFLEIKE